MEPNYLAVRTDDEIPSQAELDKFRAELRKSFEGLDFVLQEDPFSVPSLFAQYTENDGEGLVYEPNVDREVYEHRNHGGSLIIEYADRANFGFCVDTDGPEIDGHPSSLFADVAMVMLGIKESDLVQKVKLAIKPFEKLRYSTDDARF